MINWQITFHATGKGFGLWNYQAKVKCGEVEDTLFKEVRVYKSPSKPNIYSYYSIRSDNEEKRFKAEEDLIKYVQNS